jgi:hypothetical protein
MCLSPFLVLFGKDWAHQKQRVVKDDAALPQFQTAPPHSNFDEPAVADGEKPK